MEPHFYIDESGNFRDAGDGVTVGGPVFAEEVPDLRARLERALPGLPWPLHAAHVNRPIVWAIEASLSTGSDGNAVDADIDRALTILRRTNSGLLEAARANLREGSWPAIDVLMALEASIWQEAPAVMKALTNRVRNARALVAVVGGQLSIRAGVVVAGEASWGILSSDRPRRRTGHDETDRYYAALQAAIGRAREVAEAKGAGRLLVTVLTRPVSEPAEGGFRSLAQDDVQSLIDELPASACVIELQPIARWDESVPAACVLADYCTNASRLVLQDPLVSLETAERHITAAVGLQARSGSPPRSHLVAVFLPGAEPAGSGGPPPIGVRQWAWEQASEAARARV